MSRVLWFCVATIMLALLLAATALIAVIVNSGGSAGGTLASGRSVQVTSDSIWLRCQFSRDTATIRTAGKTIVVAPAGLLVDGRLVAPLEPRAKSVVITAERGGITLVADGTEITTSRF